MFELGSDLYFRLISKYTNLYLVIAQGRLHNTRITKQECQRRLNLFSHRMY
jgi:hypothetical protein